MKTRLTAHPPFVKQKYIRHDSMFPYLGIQTMVKHNSSSRLIRTQKRYLLSIYSTC